MFQIFYFFFFLNIFLTSSQIYNIIFKNNIFDSQKFSEISSLYFLSSNCQILFISKNLFVLSFYSLTLRCQNNLNYNITTNNEIKYIEINLKYEITQKNSFQTSQSFNKNNLKKNQDKLKNKDNKEKISLSQQQLRSEESKLYSDNHCTITYDTYHTLNYERSLLHPTEVYILDTGIQSNHSTFGGRVIHEFDVFSPIPIQYDPNGHGTQVAGIVAGAYHGLSQNISIIDIRIADSNGVSSTHHIIQALDYIVGKSLNPFHSIICMCLSSQSQSKVLRYLLFLLSKYVLFIGSAGNHAIYSCQTSPAESPHALIVGATSHGNDLQSFSSNFGDCVDIYAPGEMIITPFIGSSIYKQSYLSGTSASTAIITGIASIILSYLQTPLSKLSIDKSNASYEIIISSIQNLEIDKTDSLSLSEILPIILNPSDFPLFIRSIITSVHHHLERNRTKLVHLPSFYTCDYHDTNSLKNVVIETTSHLLKQFNQPKAFFSIKRNLANFLKKQSEDYYEKIEGWNDENGET